MNYTLKPWRNGGKQYVPKPFDWNMMVDEKNYENITEQLLNWRFGQGMSYPVMAKKLGVGYGTIYRKFEDMARLGII